MASGWPITPLTLEEEDDGEGGTVSRTVTVTLVGTNDKLEALLALLQPLGVLEVVLVAHGLLERGSGSGFGVLARGNGRLDRLDEGGDVDAGLLRSGFRVRDRFGGRRAGRGLSLADHEHIIVFLC